MNIFPFFTLLSVAVCLVTGSVVYHSNRKGALNRVFALYNVSSALYLFASFMCQQSQDAHVAYFWAKGIIPVSVSFFLHFVMIVTKKDSWLKNKLVLFLLYAPIAFFSILGITTGWLTAQPKMEYWGYAIFGSSYADLPYPWLFMAMNLCVLLIISFSLILLIHHFHTAVDTVQKKRTRYYLFSFTVPVLLGSLETALVLLKIKTPPLDPIVFVWLNVFIGYGIWKFDLFKIDPIKAMENILSTMPDSLLLTDLENKIVEVNPTLIKVFGYSRDEIIGKPMEALFDDKAVFKALLDHLKQGREEYALETEFKTKSGRCLPIQLSSTLIKTRITHTIGIVYIVHDVSKLKQSEEALLLLNRRLIQSNQDLHDFAHVASHDLQEPLRKIKTFGDRLKEKSYAVLEDQSRDYLERMQDAAVRMQTLIDDLLSYSRVTTKTEPFSPVDLEQIVKEVLSDLEVRIEKTSAQINIEKLPAVSADPTQMRQLFQNLIGNALKFHKPDIPPVIRIYSLPEDQTGYISIAVEDNGIGIDESYYDTIFGVFQRLHGKNEYEGSGIGLAVCKKIAERHGGSIRVESKVGIGTKFMLKLPLRAS